MSNKVEHKVIQVTYKYTPVNVNEPSEHYYVLCHMGKPEEWREDKTIPLVDVVQRFEVYTGSGQPQKASNSDLERVFGTKDMDQVIRKILEEGNIPERKAFNV